MHGFSDIVNLLDSLQCSPLGYESCETLVTTFNKITQNTCRSKIKGHGNFSKCLCILGLLCLKLSFRFKVGGILVLNTTGQYIHIHLFLRKLNVLLGPLNGHFTFSIRICFKGTLLLLFFLFIFLLFCGKWSYFEEVSTALVQIKKVNGVQNVFCFCNILFCASQMKIIKVWYNMSYLFNSWRGTQ